MADETLNPDEALAVAAAAVDRAKETAAAAEKSSELDELLPVTIHLPDSV